MNTSRAHSGKRRIDPRAHQHPAWWAFIVHRVSGLLLGLFLPLHFWALGEALQGAAGLDGALSFAHHPLVKVAEWGLVLLLSVHAAGGVRLLLIEFGPWSGLRKNGIALAAGLGLAVSLAFALALLG